MNFVTSIQLNTVVEIVHDDKTSFVGLLRAMSTSQHGDIYVHVETPEGNMTGPWLLRRCKFAKPATPPPPPPLDIYTHG